jgi:hypothetical protein
MMKKHLKKMIPGFLFVTGIAFLWTGCTDNEGANILPGLSVEPSEIQTWQEGTVRIEGTASNYVGLKSIRFSCVDWGIEERIDLSFENPTVFNYVYSFVVPADAGISFQKELLVEVVDVNNKSTQKRIPITYLQDTQSPVFTQTLPLLIPVDATGTGEIKYNFRVEVQDDRQVHAIRVYIPDISVSDEVIIKKPEGSYEKELIFPQTGIYPLTVYIIDSSGNETAYSGQFVVMMEENEDAVQDYSQMYLIFPDNSPENYLAGYYQFMERKEACQYSTKFYAPEDNTQIAFVPTESIDGDYYGVSPLVNTKLINKNGYAIPVNIPEKGYYWIDINIQEKNFSIYNYEIPETAYTGPLTITGTGWEHADWSFSSLMTLVDKSNPYRRELSLNVVNPDQVELAFTTNSWDKQWKGDGKYWYESSEGANFSFKPGASPGLVHVTFDTAILWATVEKK